MTKRLMMSNQNFIPLIMHNRRKIGILSDERLVEEHDFEHTIASCTFSTKFPLALVVLINGDVHKIQYEDPSVLSSKTIVRSDIRYKFRPRFLFQDTKIKFVVMGEEYYLIYRTNGDLLLCGDICSFGFETNLATIDYHGLYAKKLTNDKFIKKIYCAYSHIIILKNNGDIFVYGFNINGQLGSHHEQKIANLVLYDTSPNPNPNIIDIFTTSSRTYLLYDDHSIERLGLDECETSGIHPMNDMSQKIKINDVLKQCSIMFKNNFCVRKIAIKYNFSIFLVNDNTLLCFGLCNISNKKFVLIKNDGNITINVYIYQVDGIKDIIADDKYFIVLKYDGTIMFSNSNKEYSSVNELPGSNTLPTIENFQFQTLYIRQMMITFLMCSKQIMGNKLKIPKYLLLEIIKMAI